MDLGLVGLGRMGSNMARRLMAAGHRVVAFDRSTAAVDDLAKYGATPARSLPELLKALRPPRAVWLMLPAAVVDETIGALRPQLSRGDTLIDGGNSHYHDDIRRAGELAAAGLHYVDVGTSGGVWGLTRGYCLMIGGEPGPVEALTPLFAALAPGPDSAPTTPGRQRHTSADDGFLHCGPPGAGHFVKMVHNGIEYGLMAAFAEGLNLLRHADVGETAKGAGVDAETTPLRHPEHFRYKFDLAEVTEVWRRGSVVSSWLLDLAAGELARAPDLAAFKGRVSDSGEGRWTIDAAVAAGVPAPVLSAALFARFSSRDGGDFAAKILSAMRHGFGGHEERPATGGGKP